MIRRDYESRILPLENGYIRTNDMQKDDTKRSGKIESRFVSVAVNNTAPRSAPKPASVTV